MTRTTSLALALALLAACPQPGAAPPDEEPTPDDGPEPVQQARTLVSITAPAFGGDLATHHRLVTLEGIASEDVVELWWFVQGGLSGPLEPGPAWSLDDLELRPGDNRFTVVATDSEGVTDTDRVTIRWNPGVPLSSELILSLDTIPAGEATWIQAGAWLAGTEGLDPGSLRLGPSDPDGDPLATWTTLEPTGRPGYFTGSFVVDELEPTGWELRAWATFGEQTGATPAVPLRVVSPPTGQQLSAAMDLGEDVHQAFVEAGGTADPDGGREAALALLTERPEVTALGIGPGGAAISWEVAPGLGFVLDTSPPGTRGAGDDGPVPPTSGTGALRATTRSSSGVSGLRPTRSGPEERDGYGMGTTRNVASFMAPALAEFGAFDETVLIEEWASEMVCPRVESTGVARNEQADLDAFAASLFSDLQVISAHGATVTLVGGVPDPDSWNEDGPDADVVIFTSGTVPSDHLGAWLSGQLVYDPAQQDVGFLPSWVRARTAGAPIPEGAIVSVSACSSMAAGGSLAQAWLASGAGFFLGYQDEVDSDYAFDQTSAFWEVLLPESGIRGTTGDAIDAVQDPLGLVGSQGDTGIFVGTGDLLNGGFEAGTEGWETPDWGAGNFTSGLVAFYPWGSPIPGSSAPEGERMGSSWVSAPESQYDAWSQTICPGPGETIDVSFRWQVLAGLQAGSDGCQLNSNHWLNLRLDDLLAPDDNAVLWSVDWNTGVCSLAPDEASYRNTGWQQQTVSFVAPGAELGDQFQLAFSIGGYNAFPWHGLVDDVHIGLPLDPDEVPPIPWDEDEPGDDPDHPCADPDTLGEEVCDGEDNDGDGQVDEGFDCIFETVQDCELGGSECAGTQICLQNCTWSPCENPDWECAPGDEEACQAGACDGSRGCASDCTWEECHHTCGADFECCDDGCKDVQSDWHNCGTCDRECEFEDGCYVGACCVDNVRNGSEVCDDQRWTVSSPYLPLYLVCRNDNGGIAYVSSNTGPPMEDGISRCQGWEENGQDAWDHLNYIYQMECTVAGTIMPIDLSAWEGSGLYMGAHDHPNGGGDMTEICVAEAL